MELSKWKKMYREQAMQLKTEVLKKAELINQHFEEVRRRERNQEKILENTSNIKSQIAGIDITRSAKEISEAEKTSIGLENTLKKQKSVNDNLRNEIKMIQKSTFSY